jgi:hypothetical protein
MSLLQKSLSGVGQAVRRVAAWCGLSRHPWRRRPGRRLLLEPLEAREVLTTAIGMNLERVSDSMAAPMFTDAFKQSRNWGADVYNTTTHTLTVDTAHLLPVTLDAHGWPTALSSTTNAQGQVLQQRLETDMLTGLNGHYPAGIYHTEWQGTGTVEWNGDVHVVQQGMTAAGNHFALLSDTPANAGIRLRIDAMSAADPIRNVHVWLPDYNGQSFVGQVWQPGANFSPFYPLFLQRLAPFGTLRFTQDAATNTSQVRHWSDLKPVGYETQMNSATALQNGMAPQYMIEMSNELKADLWVNMPHLADDNFIRTYATLVRDTLQPGLKVYVEWSNEVWNPAPGHLVYQWVRQQVALPQNAGVTFEQFVARENQRTFAIWSQVFAGQTNRLERVVAGIEAVPGYAANVLQNMNGQFDAVACAAYFSPTPAQCAAYGAATTADQVLNDMAASLPTWLGQLRAHRALADQYAAALGRPIRFVAYQGGAELIGDNQLYQAAYNAAAVNPRMYDLLRQFLQGANQVGLDLFVDFQFTERNDPASPFGISGALNYLDQPTADAPKYRALLEAANGSLFASGPVATPPVIIPVPAASALVVTAPVA